MSLLDDNPELVYMGLGGACGCGEGEIVTEGGAGVGKGALLAVHDGDECGALVAALQQTELIF